eukprot:Tbor_TRINITY_DN6031_c2_g1::TRINITY_DN6031_c2_g1_i1::g.11008::m.11008
MSFSCTGGVRYHVSDNLCDRHPYSSKKSFGTQPVREAGHVHHSHNGVAPTKLLKDLVELDSPYEKLKALRLINLHVVSAENKIAFLRIGLARVLAVSIATAIRQYKAEASRDNGTLVGEDAVQHKNVCATWAQVEQLTSQVIRSICAVPQGCFLAIEEGCYSALVASLGDRSGAVDRMQARTCAAGALSLLSSCAAARSVATLGPINGPEDISLSNYACESVFMSLRDREEQLGKFFEVAGECLEKDYSCPLLLLSVTDAVSNFTLLVRGLHLSLVAGIHRYINQYVANYLITSDLWVIEASKAHKNPLKTATGSGYGEGSTTSTEGNINKINSEQKTSENEIHNHPGSTPPGINGAKTNLVRATTEAEIATCIALTISNIGLDPVGKQEILELPSLVMNVSQLLRIVVEGSSVGTLLRLKSTLACAIGYMCLLTVVKKLCVSPLEVRCAKSQQNTENRGHEDLITDKGKLCCLDVLIGLLKDTFPFLSSPSSTDNTNNNNTEDAKEGRDDKQIDDEVSKLTSSKMAIITGDIVNIRRDFTAVIGNCVHAIRLIAEYPGARDHIHVLFDTRNPPVNPDGPPNTIKVLGEGRYHELRRQIFYSTRFSEEFKVYVY